MSAKTRSFCIVCDRTMGYLWTGSRRQFPDYLCGDCYKAWACDATGEPIPYPLFPRWLKALWNAETARRARRRRAEKAGVDPDGALPLTELRAKLGGSALPDAELLESLGARALH